MSNIRSSQCRLQQRTYVQRAPHYVVAFISFFRVQQDRFALRSPRFASRAVIVAIVIAVTSVARNIYLPTRERQYIERSRTIRHIRPSYEIRAHSLRYITLNRYPISLFRKSNCPPVVDRQINLFKRELVLTVTRFTIKSRICKRQRVQRPFIRDRFRNLPAEDLIGGKHYKRIIREYE